MSVGDNTFRSTVSGCCVKSDRYLTRQSLALVAISSHKSDILALSLGVDISCSVKSSPIFNQSPMD